MKHLSAFLSAIIYNDEDLRTELRKEILENIDALNDQLSDDEKQLLTKSKDEFIEYFLNKFGESLYIELPKPENTNLTNLSAEYDIYKDNLEKVLDSVLSSEIFTENIAGELSQHIDTIKNVYKHHLLRTWMANNNFYPEALEFGKQNNENDDADKLIEIIQEHLVGTSRNSDKLLNLLQTYKDALNKDLEKISGDGAASSSFSGSSTDDNGDENSEGGGGGTDDFGLDLGSDTDLTL
jgi:uncharacterized membrane protein YheB (UPF0754 family)